MKKRFIIILSIQTILILLMMAYAFIQKLEADKQRVDAVQAQLKAEEMYKRTVELEHELKDLQEQQENNPSAK